MGSVIRAAQFGLHSSVITNRHTCTYYLNYFTCTYICINNQIIISTHVDSDLFFLFLFFFLFLLGNIEHMILVLLVKRSIHHHSFWLFLPLLISSILCSVLPRHYIHCCSIYFSQWQWTLNISRNPFHPCTI